MFDGGDISEWFVLSARICIALLFWKFEICKKALFPSSLLRSFLLLPPLYLSFLKLMVNLRKIMKNLEISSSVGILLSYLKLLFASLFLLASFPFMVFLKYYRVLFIFFLLFCKFVEWNRKPKYKSSGNLSQAVLVIAATLLWVNEGRCRDWGWPQMSWVDYGTFLSFFFYFIHSATFLLLLANTFKD